MQKKDLGGCPHKIGNAMQTSFLAKEVEDFILLHCQEPTYVYHHFMET